jgi:hypothetical protein
LNGVEIRNRAAVQQAHMEVYADDRVSTIANPARQVNMRAQLVSASHAPVFPRSMSAS